MTEPQVSQGLIDWFHKDKNEGKEVTPQSLIADLEAAKARVKAYEGRLADIENAILAFAVIIKRAAPLVLPLLRPLLAMYGIVIPPEWLLFLTTADAPMPRIVPAPPVLPEPVIPDPPTPMFFVPPGTMHPLAEFGVGADADHSIGAPLE